MEKLLIIQPYLTSYRVPVFHELADKYIVTLVFSSPSNKSGFGTNKTSHKNIHQIVVNEYTYFNGRIVLQTGLTSILIRTKPDKILCSANPRSLSFWWTLVLSHFVGAKFFSWGQGFYDKQNPSKLHRFIYKAITTLSTKYICYTELSRETLLRHVNASNVAVATNSINITHKVPPEQKSGQESGVLFVGRIRPGSRLSLLISALQSVRERARRNDIELHIVGSGEEEALLQQEFSQHNWIHWHGGIYDQSEIANISRLCSIGCYPGDAGLSVVQFMALSLITIVHDRDDKHMGPEPSYVKDKQNGRRFAFDCSESDLARTIAEVLGDPIEGHRLAKNAWSTFLRITEPSLGQRLLKALD